VPEAGGLLEQLVNGSSGHGLAEPAIELVLSVSPCSQARRVRDKAMAKRGGTKPGAACDKVLVRKDRYGDFGAIRKRVESALRAVGWW
jgi:hypothetical protein